MRWLVSLLALFSVTVIADQAQIEKAITGINSMIEIKSVKPIDDTPFYEVTLKTGERIYTDSTGSHFVAGDLYQVDIGGVKNLTDIGRRSDFRELVSQIDESELIIFSPKGEVKHRLLVFTDIDCGYCRRLHSEIEQLQENGVEVRYAAFPRAGVGSDSYKKYVSVFCAKDQNVTMTLAKAGKMPEPATCDNPVADQYKLGQKLGITGTPTLIFEDGEMQPGYAPWKELLKRMNQQGS